MHILHGAGQVWYKDVIPDKKIYFDILDSHVIEATMFITSMIDATFYLPDVHENRTRNVRLSNTPKSPQKPESQNKANTPDAKPDTLTKK